MPNLAANARAVRNATRRAHLADLVTLRRGLAETADVPARRIAVTVDLLDATGATVQAERTDWIVEAADYAIAAEAVTPAAGDEIEILDPDGVTRTYQAVPRGSESHYRATDGGQTAWRVHTQLIKEDSA